MSESQAHVLRFDALPSLTALYGKGLLARRKAVADAVLPRIEASARALAFDPRRLAEYRRVCGFEDAPHVPITFPQVLAAPLHASIIAHEAFPFSSLGLVHVRGAIRQHRAIDPGEVVDVAAFVEGTRDARLGREFDLETRVSVGGETVWESTTTALSRQARKKQDRPKEQAPRDPPGEPPGSFRSVIWRVPEDAGRRYAAVSGDYNPIHLHAITARLFGFPRAIATGMWTLARCLASLEDVVDLARARVTVNFRRPVLLPSTVCFSAQRTAEGGISFGVRGREAGGALFLAGTIA